MDKLSQTLKETRAKVEEGAERTEERGEDMKERKEKEATQSSGEGGPFGQQGQRRSFSTGVSQAKVAAGVAALGLGSMYCYYHFFDTDRIPPIKNSKPPAYPSGEV